MRQHKLILVGLAVVFCLVSCKKDKNEEETKRFDRVGMLSYLANNTIGPTHAELLTNVGELKRLSDAFAVVSNEENLTGLQTQWKKSMALWKKSELFVFGKVKDSFLSNKIDTWPTQKSIIDTILFDDRILTDSIFKQLAIVSKGFPAVEYFVFNLPYGNIAVLDSFTKSSFLEKRKTYLGYLTKDLLDNVTSLYNIWAPEGENYLAEFSQTDGTDVTSSLSLLVNNIIRNLENTLHKRLAIPLGNENNGIPEPEKVESQLSTTSLENIGRIMASLREVIVGATPAGSDALTLKSHLDACKAMYGNELLSQKLIHQIDKVEEKRLSIPMSLHLAVSQQRLSVEGLKEAIRDLLVLFKADVASQLSVTIVPSDNDGD